MAVRGLEKEDGWVGWQDLSPSGWAQHVVSNTMIVTSHFASWQALLLLPPLASGHKGYPSMRMHTAAMVCDTVNGKRLLADKILINRGAYVMHRLISVSASPETSTLQPGELL